MNDIIEDPVGWARKAAGTPLRLIGLICLHIGLLVFGYVLNQLALFVVAGLALPALYLYAMYRMSNRSSSSDAAHNPRLERTSAR